MRVFQMAVRLALILLICLAGWSLAQSYREMFRAPSEPVLPRPVPVADPLRSAQVQYLLPGSWNLAGTDWAVRLDSTESANLDRRLADAAKEPAGPEATPLERKIIASLASTSKFREEGSRRLYEVALDDGRLRIVTERERILAAQVDWSLTANTSGTLTITPLPRQAAVERKDQHVLPLPTDMVSLARRWDDGGRLVGEFVGPVADPSALVAKWEQQGWAVEVLVRNDAGATGWQLRRPGQCILVWKFGGTRGTAENFLLLAAGRLAGASSVE